MTLKNNSAYYISAVLAAFVVDRFTLILGLNDSNFTVLLNYRIKSSQKFLALLAIYLEFYFFPIYFLIVCDNAIYKLLWNIMSDFPAKSIWGLVESINCMRNRTRISLFTLFWLDSIFFNVVFINLLVIYIIYICFQCIVSQSAHFITIMNLIDLSLLYYVQLPPKLCRTIIRMLHLVTRIFPSIHFWIEIRGSHGHKVSTYMCTDICIFTYLIEIVPQTFSLALGCYKI